MDNVEMTPDDVLQAVLAEISQDAEQALAHMDELLQLYGGDARLHFLRGSVLAGAERYAEGRVAMRRAVDVAPDYTLARFQLGLLELSMGEATVAQSTWLPLLELPSDNSLNRFVTGLNKMLEGEFASAISLLEEGMALNTELAPMNRDMALMVSEMRSKLEAQPVAEDVESDAHFLLKQYSFRDVKH